MPLDKIEIHCTFHLGDNNYFKIDAGGTIAKGETKESLTHEAVKFSYDSLEKYYPDFNIVKPSVLSDIKVNTSAYDKSDYRSVRENLAGSSDEYLKFEIGTCEDLKVLESYKFIVKGKPEVQQVYDLKFNQLTKNNFITL